MASFKTYLSESYNELVNKVSWPTWKELQGSAIVVLVTAMIISLLVFVMDYVFGVHNMTNGSFWKGILGFIYKLMS
ncbi:MAG: preprotein translocase subunit SecE [Flavobacteriales bacterium]|nr:preprotein translocase subunit SecE [Flavobacteriales bacterium]MBK6754655.1 preprotein translocase subunit SecE [Flavobacteriales bacterium]MBK7085853.1 preprotein translocase subunit SecE [Flavobacteriales bacterium]MBK7268587.1 preprotein translocase subunit SecE [Flavobacteriales bacterium]MBK7754326.1 preprotein translocase subunit SecE [Flavobacteriales bacterium]